MEAKNSGQQTIPIHIFPVKLDEKGARFLNAEYESNTTLLEFWKNLKTGYDYFESRKMLPIVTVDNTGRYIFK